MNIAAMNVRLAIQKNETVTDRIGLDWIGLDWIGLDWIGLDWEPHKHLDRLLHLPGNTGTERRIGKAGSWNRSSSPGMTSAMMNTDRSRRSRISIRFDTKMSLPHGKLHTCKRYSTPIYPFVSGGQTYQNRSGCEPVRDRKRIRSSLLMR